MLYNEGQQLTIAYKLTDQSLKDKLKWFKQFPEIELVSADSIDKADENIPLLRITKKGLFLEHNQRLFFHPSMSILRLVNIIRGDGDRFMKAADLHKGDSFLDATMGLATDLLIASWAVGEEGKALGIESSPLIYALVTEGLDRMNNQTHPKTAHSLKKQAWAELCTASSYIKTIYANHLEYLKSLPDSSIDVIFFDPMFRVTLDKSSSIKPIKIWSNPGSIALETIDEAIRVAKRRIVLKERKNSCEFARLGFETMLENKYSPTDFGIIDISKLGGV